MCEYISIVLKSSKEVFFRALIPTFQTIWKFLVQTKHYDTDYDKKHFFKNNTSHVEIG